MPNYPELDVKDVLHVELTFFDEDGVAVDPTTVTFQIKKPDGTTDTAVPTNPSIGEYHADYLIDSQTGIWSWRFEGAGGTAAAAEERTFTVKRSAFYT